MRGLTWTLLASVMVLSLVALIAQPLAMSDLSAPPISAPPNPAPMPTPSAVAPTPSASGTQGSDASPTGSPPSDDDRITVARYRPKGGPVRGGTRVRIDGTNLDTVTGVRFGDRSAIVRSQSPTQLVVVAPAGTSADPVTIVLEHPKGGVEAGRFSYRR